MTDMAPWIVIGINTVAMLLGFATLRREQARDAEKNIGKAVANEQRLTRMETHIVQIMAKLGMSQRV